MPTALTTCMAHALQRVLAYKDRLPATVVSECESVLKAIELAVEREQRAAEIIQRGGERRE